MTNAFPLRTPVATRTRTRLSRVGLEAHPVNDRVASGAVRDAVDQADSLFFALARSVDERDRSLGRHCERLALMSSVIGVMLGLPAGDIAALNSAGYLHDIGKLDLPDSILLKQGPLTSDEWDLMKKHPIRGEEICKDVPALQSVLPIIRHHHERWDGTGYPDGLQGDEIPLLARILQMADIYDALISQRPYKKAFSREQSIAIFEEETVKGWRDPSLLPILTAISPLFHSESFWDLAALSLNALASSLLSYNLPRLIRQA